MDAVYKMGDLRVVDLSKILDPSTETRRCKLYRFNTGGPIPDFHTNMDLMSHLGTHAECPYHHAEDWPSVAEVPLTVFMGRAIYVNVEAAPNSYITAELLDKYCLPMMKDDTIVVLDSPHKLTPFTPCLRRRCFSCHSRRFRSSDSIPALSGHMPSRASRNSTNK